MLCLYDNKAGGVDREEEELPLRPTLNLTVCSGSSLGITSTDVEKILKLHLE